MVKRAVAVFLMLVVAFAGEGYRISSIKKNAVQVQGMGATSSIDIGYLRGTVYDCNGKPLTNAQTEYYASVKPTNEALSVLRNVIDSETFDYARNRMSQGRAVTVKLNGFPDSSADMKVFGVPVRYDADFLACHIIGYVDSRRNGISGIEKSFDDLLSKGGSEISVRFSANANGGVMLGEDISVFGNEAPKAGVMLTVDETVQKITEAALDISGAKCSAAVVIDVESGAIRACASRPSFDPNDIADYLDNSDSPLINRALLPFSVGSVFKPVVAAAALESGVSENFEYNCTGSITLNGVTFRCHKREGHGVLNMAQATAYSCNTYFIAVALETGAESIIGTAENFGFGTANELADGLKSASGYLPSVGELDSKAALSNLSFGQGSFLATPLQICSMMSAIARGGIYITPYLIEGTIDGQGRFTGVSRYNERRQIIAHTNAVKIRKFLEAVTDYGSGKRAVTDFVSVAGKTATAQTGKTENGREIYNAWFAGYFPADKPKYAVAVMIEDGGEGALRCAPVFKDIAEAVTITENSGE